MKRSSALALLAFVTCLSSSAATFDAAKSINAVGLDLYRQLSSAHPQGNLVLSPYSIETALALVHAGAAAETRRELEQVLRLPSDDNASSAGLGALRSSLDEAVQRSGSRPITLHIANRLFGQHDHAFHEPFLTLLRDRFAAPFEPLDFRTHPAAARKTINTWVADQTRGHINDLLPTDAVTPATRLVLVNALYLKAPWAKPFAKGATRPLSFRLADGTAPKVPTMQRTEPLGYVDERDFVVAALDYAGSGLQFLIILPTRNTSVATAAAQLTPEHFTRWAGLGDQARSSVALSLPKFCLASPTIPLGKTLRTLGVRRAFDEPPGSADFSRIAPRKPNDYLVLSDVYHQAVVEIDEQGTVAAAATAAAVAVGGFATPIEVRVDRPFLFAIQHRATAVCLFLGRVDDPR